MSINCMSLLCYRSSILHSAIFWQISKSKVRQYVLASPGTAVLQHAVIIQLVPGDKQPLSSQHR